MHIANITHYADLYGANRSLLDLVLEVRARGAVEPSVLLPRAGPLSERLAQEGIVHAVVPWELWMSDRYYVGRPHHRLKQYLGYQRDARERAKRNKQALPAVLEQLRRWNPQLVHVNSAAVALVPGLLKHLGVPLVWHIRELPEEQYLLHLDAGRKAYGQALRSADQLIVISEAVKDDVQHYAGKSTAVEVIYNGVLRLADYAELASHSEERWRAPSPFTFLLAGLIHPSKGQEEAIRALALVKEQCPDVRLVIAGGGKTEHLKRLIAETGMQTHVDLPGFVPDMRPLLLSSHALLMCSRNEAMGRVTVEGMGSGLPVIGHNSGGTPELIGGEYGGLLYDHGPEELAQLMIGLANDPAKAREMGQHLMRSAAERFNVERYATEVLGVYRSVLSRFAK